MRQIFIWLGVVLVVVLIGVWWGYTAQLPATVVPETVPAEVTVRVGKAAAHAVPLEHDLTALAATRRVADVIVDDAGSVVEIDGVVSESGRRQAWLLFVNDGKTPVVPITYVVQPGDRLEWLLRRQ